MGEGEEALGKTLLKAFIFALTQQDALPKTILFYNSGAFVTSTEGPSIEDLKTLEAQGVDILTCGTCLDYYHRKEQLLVGGITNMYSIVETLEKGRRCCQALNHKRRIQQQRRGTQCSAALVFILLFPFVMPLQLLAEDGGSKEQSRAVVGAGGRAMRRCTPDFFAANAIGSAAQPASTISSISRSSASRPAEEANVSSSYSASNSLFA